MKIAMLAPFEESVPPKKYGGTELVIYNLTEELVKMGNDITVFGVGGTKTSGELIRVFDHPIREEANLKLREYLKFVGMGRLVELLRSSQRFDVIHNHIGWRFLPFVHLFSDSLVVTTLHGPIKNMAYDKILEMYGSENFISISKNQQSHNSKLNFISNVYNGIDVEKFPFEEKPKDYFAFLGRMSPEKGPVQAIEIAKKSGNKLIMAAKVDNVDREYFEKNVKPKIDGEQIQFIGEVDHIGKSKLLSGAKALIAPIQWDEPFGLYFVEAMACGTPVITLDRGSVREIITDKQTGFICQSLDEMVGRMSKINEIDRRLCRKEVLTRFSTKSMAESYLAAYKQLLNKTSKKFNQSDQYYSPQT